MTRVKICGMKRQEDAELAISLGADEIGFILEPSSPRFVSAIPAWLSADVAAYAVFGPLPLTMPEIGSLGIQFIPDWSSSLPSFQGRKVRPVLRPKPDTDWMQVRDRLQEAGVSELVMDPYHPDAFGGTGKTLDDTAVDKAQEMLQVKLIIAGGLTPENVADVIKRHKPFGIDVSSGVESAPGIKDHQKLAAFIKSAKSAG
jgi:phosphoribosylanthranilate isomerase